MRRVLNLALVGLALAGCSGTKSDTGDGTSTDGGSADGGSTADGGGEDTAPPDTQDWCGVQEIFDAKCTACHAGGSPAGRLDLYTDAHAAIVGVESALYPSYILVVPGSPEQSFLLAKVENTHDPDTEGDAMPPNNGLDAERASIVRQWILDGATSDCDPEEDGGSSGDGGSVESYHPAGYGEPTVHGMEAKLADQVCADCHGADLRGSGEAPSCDD